MHYKKRGAQIKIAFLLATLAMSLSLAMSISLSLPARALSIVETAPRFAHLQPEERIVAGENGVSYVLRGDALGLTGVTVRTLVTVHEAGALQSAAAIRLAGLDKDESDTTGYLELVWAPNASSWFGAVWSLKLQSSDGFPLDLGDEAELQSGAVTPAPGHQYESQLSYDPSTGLVSVSVADVTDGKILYKGVAHGPTNVGGLRPSAAIRVSQAGGPDESGDKPKAAFDRIATIDAMDVVPQYLPIAVDWRIGIPANGEILVQASNFGLDDVLEIRLDKQGTIPGNGSFRLVYLGGDGVARELDAATLVSTGRLPILAGDLPLGASRLHLQYLGEDGAALLEDARNITVGRLRFEYERLQIDRDAGEITGSFHVTGPTPDSGIGVRVDAVIEEVRWDPNRRRYDKSPRETLRVFDGSIRAESGTKFEFRVPLPPDPGLWSVSLVPTADLGISVETSGMSERWFTTYEPATIEPGEPYTIAILPDTQLYSYNRPEIFTRQTEWLASNAERLNIGLAIHLGDVTETNHPREWERAEQSMSLLDGVIPYTVSVGNHDILAGSYSVYDRKATLLNEYFPESKFPLLQGTFEPGRVENSFYTVRLGETDYLIVVLEYGPRDEVVEWANEVVAAHPDHTAIVMTHTYLARTGTARISPYFSSDYPQNSPLSRVPGETVNDGEQLWKKFVRQHQNILFVLSGHIPTSAIRMQMSMGQALNPVYEILADFQAEPNGGNGWLVLLEFAPDGAITARTYSPYLDRYKTDADELGFTNHVIIDPKAKRYTYIR